MTDPPAETPPAPDPTKRPLWKRFLILAVFTTIVSVPIWSGWFARSLMFPGSRRPLPHKLPPDWGAKGLTIVDYAASDGVALRGVVARAKRAEGTEKRPRPTLVYFHGNAESAADNVETAEFFAGRGFDIFVAEYRGYGLRPGSPTEEGLYKDGRAAIEAVERELAVDRSEVILVGRSLGTGVAARMASEGYGRKVVLLSPYTSMVDMAKTMVPGFLAKIAVKDRFDSVSALAKATQPVLIVHGTADPVIPFSQGRALAEGLGDRAEFVKLEGVGHNDLFLYPGRPLVLGAITTFAAAK